jgi:hypothetical protein
MDKILNYIDRFIAWMAKQPEGVPWHQTWQGILFTSTITQLPGGVKRFNEWDEFIRAQEKPNGLVPKCDNDNR